MSAIVPPQSGGRMDKRPVSLRLSAAARAILTRLSEDQGISQAGVIELLLRREDRESRAQVSFDQPR